MWDVIWAILGLAALAAGVWFTDRALKAGMESDDRRYGGPGGDDGWSGLGGGS
jgi:hypothetical protein